MSNSDGTPSSLTASVLINPTSGKGLGHVWGVECLAVLRAQGVRIEAIESTSAAHAAEWAAEQVAAGTDALIVCGGDGLVHLGLQAVAQTPVRLGVIPAGTGNDAARAWSIPRHSASAAANAAARALLNGAEATYDLGRWSPADGGVPTWFAGVVAAGFDSRVNDRANRMSWPHGRLRYDLAMVVEIGVFKPIPYRLVLDGEPWVAEAMLVAVGNAASYGGGMYVTPDASMTDGLLDVLVLSEISKFEFLRVFPKVYKGTHVTHPAVTIKRARRVELFAEDVTAYADGESMGRLPGVLEAIPNAVRVLAPQ